MLAHAISLVYIRSRQDEGGLPPAGCASTVSVLSATAKSIGMRRSAALASAATGTGNDGSADTVDTVQGRKGSEGSNGSIAAAVAAFQDCLICARRAVLAVMGAILRVSRGVLFFATSLLVL